MSLDAIAWAWRQPVDDQGELLVLLSLADYANEKALCWPSQQTLMTKSRMKSKTTLNKKLRSLQEQGLINWQRRPKAGGGSSSNLYQLLCMPQSESTDNGLSESPVSTPESPIYEPPESTDNELSFITEPVINKNQSVIEPSEPCSESPESDVVQEIFTYWQQRLNHPQAKLADTRRKKIRAALAMGYSVNDLKTAIFGCSVTPFNMGENDRGQKYDGLNIILKDADNIDRFINNAKTHGTFDDNREAYHQNRLPPHMRDNTGADHDRSWTQLVDPNDWNDDPIHPVD